MKDLVKSVRWEALGGALSYAIGHRIRIEILCLLNETTYTATELADRTPWSLPMISYHLKEMLKKGSIEVAASVKVRNVNQFVYRAIELPVVDDEEAANLPPEVKQEYAAVILQAMMAECLGAFRAQKLTEPRVRMMWDWFNLDEQGRQELANEQSESWERIVEIEARDANRRAKSGSKGTTMIAVTLGFERSKTGQAAPSSTHRFAPQETPKNF
jgi:DNA-binding transcriptional ArsR family regulator